MEFDLKHGVADPLDITEQNPAGAAGRAFGVRMRKNGIWKALTSMVLTINGSHSISMRPQESIHLWERFCSSNVDMYTDPEGGGVTRTKNGRRSNRVERGANLATNPQLFEIDEGCMRRRQFWKDNVTFPVGVVHTPRILYSTRIPLSIFTYCEDLPKVFGGRSLDSMLPYITSLDLSLNFEPTANAVRNMLECEHVQASDSALFALGEGRVHAANVPTSIAGWADSSFKFTSAPTLECRFINPGPSILLRPSYSFSVPRIVTYRQEHEFTGNGTTKRVFFSNIKTETNPVMFIISSRPKQTGRNPKPGVNVGNVEAAWIDLTGDQHGNPGLIARGYNVAAPGELYPLAANGVSPARDPLGYVLRSVNPGGTRATCGYAGQLNPVAVKNGDTADIMRITINEKSNIASSYTGFQLYKMTKDALEGRLKESYDDWRRNAYVCLRPQDICGKGAGVYMPQTMSFDVAFDKSEEIDPAYTQEMFLQLIYMDVVTIAPGSATSNAFLVNESSLGKSKMEQEKKIEDLQ